jgi:hypothetical protein
MSQQAYQYFFFLLIMMNFTPISNFIARMLEYKLCQILLWVGGV